MLEFRENLNRKDIKKKGCHAEPVEACGQRPLRAPFDRLRVTGHFRMHD